MEEVHSQYSARQQYVEKLEQDAELYEKVGLEVQPYEAFVILFTALWGMLMIWSVSNFHHDHSIVDAHG